VHENLVEKRQLYLFVFGGYAKYIIIEHGCSNDASGKSLSGCDWWLVVPVGF
jgi:hypothetical protein